VLQRTKTTSRGRFPNISGNPGRFSIPFRANREKGVSSGDIRNVGDRLRSGVSAHRMGCEDRVELGEWVSLILRKG
jgi:hypothetical protein